MSCHLSLQACIVNLKAVKNALTFRDETLNDEYSAAAWNSGWEWDEKTDGENHEIGRIKCEDQSWLQECISSVSPTIDVLALAYGQYAVFLTSKWDVSEENNSKMKFVASYEGKLSLSEKEEITSLLCLPLASQKRSLQGGPDWTCIVVGYSSGYVKMYTEKGEVLISQLLHEEPVNHLRCKTHVPPLFAGFSDQPEELLIIYSSVTVTIDGFGLFQTLRACRNQLARAAAGRQEVAQPPPLSYKKWGFQEHDKLTDCEAAGSITATSFDHLVTESIRKGFYGTVKSSIPSNSLLITTGCNPYVGFYHASEGSSQLFLTDVAQAVATKLKSFLIQSTAGGLLGLRSKNEQEESKNKPKIEPPTSLQLRFGLYDKRRQGCTIIVAPNRSLSAITDAFGRVILFDVFRGVAIRMWKGYRDAQCGWVEVEEDVHHKETDSTRYDVLKRAFFLVIYAPRRGILEVWCVQQGPRIAAFNVGKSGRLLSPGYSMVGVNFSSNSSINQHLSSCYFLDTDGGLKKIIVPFHCILSERNSKRARDLHLLKELRMSLKNKVKGKAFEVTKLFLDMKTSSIRMQAFDSLVSSRYSSVDLVEEVTETLLTHLQKQDPEQIDYEMKLLKQSSIRAYQLVKVYKLINEINMKAEAASSTCTLTDIQLFASSLCISEAEIGRLLSLVTLHQTVAPATKKHVRFVDDSATDMPFSEFVSCFSVNDSHLLKTEGEIVSHHLPVTLSNGISGKQIATLGGFVFHTAVHIGACLSTLQTALRDSGIIPENLLLLVLHYWVSETGFCGDSDKWLNLQQVMKNISSLSDPKFVSSDSDHVSPWWETVRGILLQSTNNIAAHIGAVVARSVSIIMSASFHVEEKSTSSEKKKHEESKDLADDKDGNGDSDWEAVSLDLEHWNILLKQLEDILILSLLLKSQPYGKAAVKDVNISMTVILNGGPGMITDLMAVWAVSVSLEPNLLSSFITDIEDPGIQQKIDDNKPEDKKILEIVRGLLIEVKKRFPRSTNHDALLANCCWEHMMQWSRNKDIVEHLTLSLSCLDLVRSAVIKSGFASMMWKSCVQKRFEVLTLLMDKVGKTPKERLCRKELEMNDNCLESFLDFCCQLLHKILETYVVSEIEEVPIFPPEHLWQDREHQGPTPLVTMALGQKPFSYTLVYQHLLLATVLHFIVTFQLKSIRPLGFFSSTAKKMFFKELHYNCPIQTEMDDLSMQSVRTQFLLKVVSIIAQGIPECVPETPVSVLPSRPRGGSLCSLSGRLQASKWFNSVIEVGRGWGLNIDELRRHYVCELYSGGHDTLAEEVMAAVTDNVLLGSQLLLLAGQRVQRVIFDSSDPATKLSCLPPDLSTWLKSLGDITLRCNNVPLSLTANLIDHILLFLPEEHREQAMAQSLQDAVQGLMHSPDILHS